jgi:hypothetical protein
VKLKPDRKKTPARPDDVPDDEFSLAVTLGRNKAKTAVPPPLFAFETTLQRHGE